MKTPATSRLFTRVVDPSGAVHYVLTEKKCTYQQGFYFVNNSMTNDGRYLWFYATPSPVYNGLSRQLGYVDFLLDEVVICHDAMFDDASPYVDSETGEVYFTYSKSIYRRAPGKDNKTECLCTLDIPGYVQKLCTHLTRLSDKNLFFLDINRNIHGCIQGVVDIRTGEFTEWTRAAHNTNHGQINPQNDNLALCAYDSYADNETGIRVRVPYDENGVYQRLWTVTSDGTRTMHPPINNYATHEWWSADGKKIYYCSDNYGLCSLNIETGEHECFHKCDPWHAFTTRDESLVIYDEKRLERYGGKWYRGCPASVKLLNRKTGKDIFVVTEMPENAHTPDNPNNYHIDPHPRFTDNERYVVFTTTELGGCDLAVAIIDELLPLTV